MGNAKKRSLSFIPGSLGRSYRLCAILAETWRKWGVCTPCRHTSRERASQAEEPGTARISNVPVCQEQQGERWGCSWWASARAEETRWESSGKLHGALQDSGFYSEFIHFTSSLCGTQVLSFCKHDPILSRIHPNVWLWCVTIDIDALEMRGATRLRRNKWLKIELLISTR